MESRISSILYIYLFGKYWLQLSLSLSIIVSIRDKIQNFEARTIISSRLGVANIFSLLNV